MFSFNPNKIQRSLSPKEDSGKIEKEENKETKKEKIVLEIDGQKIFIEKQKIIFREDFIKETGGVEGYVRYLLTEEELLKIYPEISSLKNFKYNFEGDKNLYSLMEKINFPKMFDGHSLVHSFDGFDGDISNSYKLLSEQGFLKQKIFDVMTMSNKAENSSHNTYQYLFFDVKKHIPIDLTKEISNYLEPIDDNVHEKLGSNVLKIRDTKNLPKEKFFSEMEKLLEHSDIFYDGTSFRGIPGLNVFAGKNEEFSFSHSPFSRKMTLSFNLNNKGFKSYLEEKNKLLDLYLISQPENGHLKSFKNKIEALLKEENWLSISNLAKNKWQSFHPEIPVIQSPKSIQLRWLHADRVTLITSKGVNFIKINSRDLKEGE